MYNPWQRFKQQPWLPFSRVAGVTLLIAAALDILLWLGDRHVPFVAQSLALLTSLDLLIVVIVGMGIGALGVHICERWQTQIYLNLGRLWALVLCLVIGLLLKTLLFEALLLPQVLVSVSRGSLLGIVIGLFWRSRHHWR